MWKKLAVFLLVCSIGLTVFTRHHIRNEKRLHVIIESSVSANPWLRSYVDIAENLSRAKSDRQYIALISKWNIKLPFLNDLVKYIGMDKGLTSLETKLIKLSEHTGFIDLSTIAYLSDRWVYEYIDTANDINSSYIPGLVMYAVYMLSQDTERFTIDNLKEAFEYRNVVVRGCENYNFIDWKTIKRQTVCPHVKATLMEGGWKRWFEYMGHGHNYLPRLVGNYALLSTKKHASLKVCNLAPYKAQSVIQYSIEPGLVEVAGWKQYDVGECKVFEKVFIDIEPEFWVHVQHNNMQRFRRITSQINKAVLSDDNSSNDNLALDLAANSVNLWNDVRQCVPSSGFTFQSKWTVDKNCHGKNSEEVTFAKAKAIGKQQENWYFFAEHPNLITFNPNRNVGDISAINEAVKRVEILARVIDTQEQFEKSWSADEIPLSLGATIHDYNGPLMPGVMLYDVASRSIGGSPMPYQNGDILMSFNGKTIYGVSDLSASLIGHGYSLSAGYQKPIKVVVQRGGKLLTYRTSYFFNSNHIDYFDVSNGEATLWGVTDAITFGNAEFSKCVGINTTKFVGNVVSGFFEGVRSVFSDSKFKNESLKKFKYIDTGKCIWRSEQRKAIAQQRHKKDYINSQWFAFFTPSSVRLLGQKAFRKYARRNIVRGGTCQPHMDS